MSFFSQHELRISSEPEPQRPTPPPWIQPPSGVLPGLLSDRAVLVRDDRLLLVVDRFRAYPTGLEFTLSLSLREPDEEFFGIPWDLRHPRAKPDDPSFLRFGIKFPDRQQWTNLSTPWPQIETEPTTPVVVGRSGGGGGDYWEMSYWLWPLPSAGELTFVAEWPAYDIAESSATIEGQRIIDAAKEAEVIWPN